MVCCASYILLVYGAQMYKILFQVGRGLEVDRCFGFEFLFFGVWEGSGLGDDWGW